MTNKEISKYINRLNLKKGSETIFCREISDNVIIAKVWPKQPKLSDSINGNFSSYNFFFIRNDFGKYIGAVLDMYSDLHWFISPKFRKQGFLTNAMKQSILPYIFYNREKQQITISRGIGKKEYLNSKKVAESLGFSSTNLEMDEFLLKKTDFDWKNESLNEHNGSLNEQRIELLRKRVSYASKLLSKTSDELLMTYNNDENLSELVDKTNYYIWSIEDLFLEQEK